MAMTSKIILLIFLSWFLGSGISAKEPLKKISNDSDAQEYVLDEITVIGKRPLSFIKMEAIRAEDLQFKIFNSLNSTDDFDITCEWHAPLGTRIKQRVCRVGYMKKERSLDAYLWLTTGQRMRSDSQLSIEFAYKYSALKKEMINLNLKHPELATATIRAQELQRRYKAEQRKRHKDSILVGNPKPDENDVIFTEIDMWQKVFLDHRSGARRKINIVLNWFEELKLRVPGS